MLSNCAEKFSTIIPKNVDCIRENILNRSIISNAMLEWFFIMLLEWCLRHSLHPIPGLVYPPQYLRCYQSPSLVTIHRQFYPLPQHSSVPRHRQGSSIYPPFCRHSRFGQLLHSVLTNPVYPDHFIYTCP